MAASKAMASPEVKPVYVLHGADAFLLDAHRSDIVSAVVGDADPQTSVAGYDGSAELADVLDDLRTLPFLAPKRVVIVRDADAFVSANREALEKYLRSPSENASLVLIVSAWPKNTKLYKIVAEIGQTIECDMPKNASVAAWLGKSAGKRGKKITPDAAAMLEEWIGRDLGRLDKEVEKLSLYVDDRDTITLADVSTLVIATAEPVAFALPDALAAGDAKAALKTLGAMLTARGEEFRTLGQIAWHLRRAARVHQAIAGGQNANTAMRAAKVFHNQREFTQFLKRRPLTKLAGDFRRLLAADRAMKTGTDATAALQQLVVALCN